MNTHIEKKISTISGIWFFLILSAYYFLRPIRETMATVLGSKRIESLFVVVFLILLILVPLYSWIVERVEKKNLISYTYRFFSLWLPVFVFAISRFEETPPWLASCFFVWLSVFNLFVVAVFWSVLADAFSSAQSKKLFGRIAAGGSLGGLFSSGLLSLFGHQISIEITLSISFLLLEAAILASSKCIDLLPKKKRTKPESSGNIWQGFISVFSSKYLFCMCLFLIFAKICGTYVYLQLIEFVQLHVPLANDRIRLFAFENLSVQVITLFFQFFATAFILKHLRLSYALSLLPLLLTLGFALFVVYPSLFAVFALQILSRTLAYGLVSPAGEVLFTVVNEEDTYKAKSFLDTAVKRGGDVVGSKFYSLIGSHVHIPSTKIGLLGFFAFLWGATAWYLGKEQETRALAINPKSL